MKGRECILAAFGNQQNVAPVVFNNIIKSDQAMPRFAACFRFRLNPLAVNAERLTVYSAKRGISRIAEAPAARTAMSNKTQESAANCFLNSLPANHESRC